MNYKKKYENLVETVKTVSVIATVFIVVSGFMFGLMYHTKTETNDKLLSELQNTKVNYSAQTARCFVRLGQSSALLDSTLEKLIICDDIISAATIEDDYND